MIEARLAQANGRLKAARLGVRIYERRGRLYLRGTFPPRPGSDHTEPYRQWLALGFRANPAGLQRAESEARLIGALLERGEFDWSPYVHHSSHQPRTCAEWIAACADDYRQRGGSADTWQGDYWKVLKWLPPEQPLSAELLRAAVERTEPNTKSRKRAAMAIGVLAKFAGIDYDPAPIAGNYGQRKVQPRDLPDDQLISAWYYRIKSPAWRWVYAMMATYGLRNHEVFRLDLARLRSGDRVISVLPQTKTGSREVWAYYPEWFEQFALNDVQLPNIDLTRSNQQIGNSVTDSLRERGLPFTPYCLRHCWAVRTISFGLPDSLAAQQMGHSVSIHTKVYHHWITAQHHQREHERLLARSDRPRAPAQTPDPAAEQ